MGEYDIVTDAWNGLKLIPKTLTENWFTVSYIEEYEIVPDAWNGVKLIPKTLPENWSFSLQLKCLFST